LPSTAAGLADGVVDQAAVPWALRHPFICAPLALDIWWIDGKIDASSSIIPSFAFWPLLRRPSNQTSRQEGTGAETETIYESDAIFKTINKLEENFL
jgi:hypothetical protein